MPLSAHLWPAGAIFATLLSPFGPAMGARLVNRVRHTRLVGPAARWLFPAELGIIPDQRGVVPEVGLDADAITRICVALRGAVQEGRQAAGGEPDHLTEELRRQNALLQQLAVDVEGLLQEVRASRADTYTVTSTITRQSR